jgi:non-homologous end joining protein Ku
MNISYAQIIITLVASLVSGMGTGLIAGRRSKKAEKIRAEEKAKDELKIELKDLQIKLYKLERDLDEWKDKYFEALQELIQVKAELEHTLIALNHIEIHNLEINDEH